VYLVYEIHKDTAVASCMVVTSQQLQSKVTVFKTETLLLIVINFHVLFIESKATLYADFDTKLLVLLKYHTYYSIHGVNTNVTRIGSDVAR
jgi:hypothetical protein